MPVNDAQRKYFTDVVKGFNGFNNSNAMQYNFATIALTDATNNGAGTVATPSVEPIGIAVVWNTASTEWVIYNDLDLIAGASADSNLPDGSPIAVVVGNEFGIGFNPENITVDADGENMTVFFRGANNAGIVKNPDEATPATYQSIDFVAGGVTTSVANINAFYAQLEKQGIMVIDNAEVVTPTFTS